MKPLKLLVVALFATILPLQAQRTAIEAAFKNVTANPKVLLNHSESYDGKLGKIRPVLEVYKFSIKYKHRAYIDEVVRTILASHTDPDCYRVESFAADGLETPRAWDLVYGEDASKKVEIGRNKNYSYAFINLVDQSPEAAGQYRTCYAVEWFTPRGIKNYTVDGRLIKTYARIPIAANNSGNLLNYKARMEPIDVAGVDTVEIDADNLFELLNKGIHGIDALDFQSLLINQNEPLAIFNTLLNEFYKSKDEEERSTICPIIYRTVKNIVASDKADKDERQMMFSLLEKMSKDCDTGPIGEANKAYLLLAMKVLRGNKVP